MTYCQCCQQDQPEAYCSKCIHQGVNAHLQWARGLRTQSSAAVSRSAAALDQQPRGINDWRRLRAEIAAKEKQCARLGLLVQERQAHLARAATQPAPEPAHKSNPFNVNLLDIRRASIQDCKTKQAQVANRILHARRVLVTEAISIFAVTQAQGGEWEIAGLSLPPPERFKAHPSSQVNAALIHLVHLLTLITHYLSITLPFVPVFNRQQHVGRPSMRASTPFINTTKFRDKTVLWMSSTASKRDARSLAKHRQFLTAYGLLSHSIAYLAWSQGVEGVGIESSDDVQGQTHVRIPATAVLRLIDALLASPTMGMRSHEPGTVMLGHLGFSLDVHKVVAAVLKLEGDEDYEGWDMVDDASAV